MTSTIVAMYDDFQSANDAVKELVDNGFSRESISFITNDRSGEYGRAIGVASESDPNAAAEGAGVGAGIGAVLGGLGGLLVGLGALAIPGIGPVVAAGPLAAALTALAGAGAGAVAGGVTGGLIGALVDMGVPEDSAQYYAEGLRRGSHLVTLNVEDYLVDQAVNIMNRHSPVDMNERVNDWRQTGWTGFREEASEGLAGMAAAESERQRTDWPASGNEPVDARQGYQAGMEDVRHLDAEHTEPLYGLENTPTELHVEGAPASSIHEETETLYGVEHSPTEFDTSDISSDYDDFTIYDNRFRQHFETEVFAGDATYDTYQPAYRYGYNLARDERYIGSGWDELEPEAHRYWDERNPGTWERFKDAIHHAWEEVKDSVR